MRAARTIPATPAKPKALKEPAPLLPPLPLSMVGLTVGDERVGDEPPSVEVVVVVVITLE